MASARSAAKREQTYTLVTATKATEAAFRRDGFTTLDIERWIFEIRPGIRPYLDVLEGDLSRRLAPPDQQVYEHHREFRLRHILVAAGDSSCYLVVQVAKLGDDVLYHQLLYASDLPFLHHHTQAIANAILSDERSVFALDRRFLPGIVDGKLEGLKQARLFRAPGLPPPHIDQLYSEIVLLDLKLP